MTSAKSYKILILLTAFIMAITAGLCALNFGTAKAAASDPIKYFSGISASDLSFADGKLNAVVNDGDVLKVTRELAIDDFGMEIVLPEANTFETVTVKFVSDSKLPNGNLKDGKLEKRITHSVTFDAQDAREQNVSVSVNDGKVTINSQTFVDGAHNAGLDGSQVIQSLSHGSQAVGSAGSSGDDVIVSSQCFMVDIVDDSRQVITRRRGNDNLLCAGIDVSLSLSLGGVETGTFQNNIDTQLAPGQLSGVDLGINRDFFTINGNGAVTPVDIVSLGNIIALRGIVLQQVSQHLGCGEVIDSDDFITVCSEHLPECETTDTTKTIDCNFYRHKTLPSVLHFSRI